MSIFGDLDLAAAADDPFAVNDGTYGAILTECTAGPTKKGDKKGMTFTYTIDESEDTAMMGRKIVEWLEIPTPADPQNLTSEEQTKASRLKARLLSLGVPQERINYVTTGDLLGTSCVIRLVTTEKNGNSYQNVRELRLRDAAADTSNPFEGASLV